MVDIKDLALIKKVIQRLDEVESSLKNFTKESREDTNRTAEQESDKLRKHLEHLESRIFEANRIQKTALEKTTNMVSNEFSKVHQNLSDLDRRLKQLENTEFPEIPDHSVDIEELKQMQNELRKSSALFSKQLEFIKEKTEESERQRQDKLDKLSKLLREDLDDS